VASLLVVIELVGDRPRPASLEVLGQARRVATGLGATLYAVVPCAAPPGYGEDDVIAVLSRHGADKVLLAVAESHAGPLRWGTHGGAVLTACGLTRAMLVLLADGPGGRDLGGRVASRLGAAALSDAFLEVEGDEVVLWQGGKAAGAPARLEGGLDFRVLALIPAGRYRLAPGDEEAEVEMLEPPEPERDFEAAGDGGPWPRCVVLGEGPPADTLLAALPGARAEDVAGAELRIAVGAGCQRLLALGGEPSCRVALGPDEGSATFASYVVDGDPLELAGALAAAVTAAGAASANP
jgi:hypothetical protein